VIPTRFAIVGGVPAADDVRPVISLRALTASDCERLVGWIDSPDALVQWSGPANFTWPLDLDQLLRDLHASAGSGSGSLLAASDADGRFVGHAKLNVQRHHRLGLIGRVVLAPEARGRGLGGAMMRALVVRGFDELGLHRLQLGVYTFNTAAIAAYQAAGFAIEGRQRDSARGSNGYWDAFVMGMLESDPRPGVEGPGIEGPGIEGPGVEGPGVRPARLTDRRRIAVLLTQLGYPQDAEQAREGLTAWAADRSGIVLVADVGGSVAGVIAVHAIPYFERPGAFARIVALSVDGDARRAGVGRRLVSAAQEWAIAHGCVAMEVTSRLVRDDAHRFYAALGYEDQRERSGRLLRSFDHSTR
jgi:RimJ/RimL family protein N-acetyltransferase